MNDAKGIFISYRREENADAAGRLADKFNEHFGENKVFRDIDSLEPGLDFVEAIERAIDSSAVMLVVIGKNWLTATDTAGHKRLENPDDYVRLEIAAALKRNIRVVPLRVQGAAMPSSDELPEDIAPLARRNAFELHDSSWRDDARRLIIRLEKVVGHTREENRPTIGEESRPTTPTWREKAAGYRLGANRATTEGETNPTPPSKENAVRNGAEEPRPTPNGGLPTGEQKLNRMLWQLVLWALGGLVLTVVLALLGVV
jgi:hypothetical protein